MKQYKFGEFGPTCWQAGPADSVVRKLDVNFRVQNFCSKWIWQLPNEHIFRLQVSVNYPKKLYLYFLCYLMQKVPVLMQIFQSLGHLQTNELHTLGGQFVSAAFEVLQFLVQSS